MQYQRVITYPNGLPAGGFFSSIGKAIGSVAKVALPAVGTLIGGPLGGVLGGAVGRALSPSAPQAVPGGGLRISGPSVSTPYGGFTAPVLTIGGGGGGGGGGSCVTKDGRPRRVRRDGKCWKRPAMNVLNPSAARRAIRRIDGARRMLRSIERQLPKTKSSSGGRKRCGCK